MNIMKIYWSAFLSLTLLLILAGCGSEQFGTTPQSNSSSTDALTTFQQTSCAGKTLVKPEVDILYVVDNSTSSYFVSNDIKNAIQNTINSISTQFDYRVIGTPLIETANGNNDYQVLSESALPASVPNNKRVSSPSQFTFFQNLVEGSTERGLDRVQKFIAAHQSGSVFRQNAYLFIVLVSNGRDIDVEVPTSPTSTAQTSAFATRKSALLVLKNYLHSQQFRLFSVTANTKCMDGYTSSANSYGAMSQALYDSHPSLPNQVPADHFDLCGSEIGTVFSRVNAEIQQEIIPHSYQYAVATNTNGNIDTNPGRIQVLKVSNGVTTPMNSGWSYFENTGTVETRVNPTTGAPIAGEPTSARHLVKFDSSNFITYPDCVSVTALSNLEYFGFVVLPKIPKTESVILKVNGTLIPQSASNGWSYIGQRTQNIKVANGTYLATPEVIRTGYMLQLNGSNNYYKSGDNVTIDYVPASN